MNATSRIAICRNSVGPTSAFLLFFALSIYGDRREQRIADAVDGADLYVGPGGGQAVAVLAGVVDIETVGIVLDDSHAVTATLELDNDLFQQGGLAGSLFGDK